MPWLAAAAALACAAAVRCATPVVLRRLPSPEPGPSPYPGLASAGFLTTTGLLSGAACALAFSQSSPGHWLAWAALGTVCVLAACIDARVMWLPRPLAVAGWVVAAAGAVVAAASDGDPWVLAHAALGALCVGGFFHAVWRVGASIGYGDVRLMATVGAVAALEGAAFAGRAVLLGTLVGAVWALVHRARTPAGVPFPYGPGLLAGPFLALAARAVGLG